MGPGVKRKARMGRPFKGESVMSMELKIRLDKHLMERIDAVSRKIGIPKAEFVREAITKHLKKYEEAQHEEEEREVHVYVSDD